MGIDVDWARPPRSCETCDYPRWHICLPPEPETPKAVVPRKPRVIREKKRTRMVHGSPEFREVLRAAQLKRWGKVKDQNRERDLAMVERYSEGNVSMRMVQEEFRVSRGVVMKVLREAEEAGNVVIRRQGQNIRASA